jgi:KDO2-lipid IV(A) lauroyltransferase
MASIGRQVEYLAARAGLALARTLSPRLADKLGAGLGRLAHALMKSRRELARDNIRRALGDSLDDAEIGAIVCSVFENTGRTLVETARFEKLGAEGVRALIMPAGRRLIREALEGGRGVIIATAHFGNWELMGVYPPVFGFTSSTLAIEQHNLKINEMLINLRESTGVKMLEVPTNARQVFRCLKQNEIVMIAADQHASAGTLVMDFFGRPAAVARGPALFAIRCGCPIVLLLIRRDRYDRHVVMNGGMIHPPDSGDEEADVRAMTRQYIEFLEKYIRKYPDQWLWTHNRWKLKDTPRNSEVDEA